MQADGFYRGVKPALISVVKPLGFRSRGRSYYRVVNDVVQRFCLLYRNYDFTIRFHVASVYGDDCLAEGHDIHRLIDGTNKWLGIQLKEEAPGKLGYVGPCAADPVHPDLELCGKVCAEVVKGYLLPFFSEAVDAESAHRLLHERELEREDHIFCYPFFLGTGEWERALSSLKEYLSMDHGPSNYWNELWKLHDALDALDVAAVLEYMGKKEAATYETLHWKRKG